MSDLAGPLPAEDARGDGDRGGSKSRRDRSRSRDKERCVCCWGGAGQLLPFRCSAHATLLASASWPDFVAVPGAKLGVTRRSTSGGTGAGPGRSAGERSHWHTPPHSTLRSHSCQTEWDTVTTSKHVRPHTCWDGAHTSAGPAAETGGAAPGAAPAAVTGAGAATAAAAAGTATAAAGAATGVYARRCFEWCCRLITGREARSRFALVCCADWVLLCCLLSCRDRSRSPSLDGGYRPRKRQQEPKPAGESVVAFAAVSHRDTHWMGREQSQQHHARS